MPVHKKTFLGMPMNWEWDLKKAARATWNADDDRIFPPKTFRIGWTVNFHAVIRKFGLAPKGRKKKSPISNKEKDHL